MTKSMTMPMIRLKKGCCLDKTQFSGLDECHVSRKTITKKQQKKRSRQRKLKAYDMSSLLEHLPKLKLPRKSKTAQIKLDNNRRRKSLVLKEACQLNAFINHSSFQLDPFDAIYQRLLNTCPAMDEKHRRKVIKPVKEESGNGEVQSHNSATSYEDLLTLEFNQLLV